MMEVDEPKDAAKVTKDEKKKIEQDDIDRSPIIIGKVLNSFHHISILY